MTNRVAVLAAAFALVASGPAFAQTEGGTAPAVEWLLPAAVPVKPQTEDEKQRGLTLGRDLPALELLQPTLDPMLPVYRPRSGAKLHGHFKAAASDVLPGLAKAWAAAFSAIHPGVRIDVDPPYAGSLGAKELVKGNIDFVFVSRELKPDDVTEFAAKFGYGPLSVPVSGGSYRHFGFLDAVGFIVNRDNPIEHLSFDQLDALYSSTHAAAERPRPRGAISG